jgi:hypothetical protein
VELWTRSEGGGWRRSRGLLTGIASLLDDSVEAVLLVGDGHHPDDATAAVRVARALGDERTAVLAATPHPSARWASSVHEAGAARLLLAERGDPAGYEEITLPICPALHASTGDGVALSVCGRHGDRMVLAATHLQRWCLGHNGACPHWRAEPPEPHDAR